MKKHAVLITILFALLVTIGSVSSLFWEFYKLNKEQYINHIFTKYSVINQIFRDHLQRDTSEIMLEANLAVYKLQVEKSKLVQNAIRRSATLLKKENFKNVNASFLINSSGLYQKNVVSDLTVSMMEFDDTIYFDIETPMATLFIEDEELQPYRYTNLLYTYFAIIITIFLSFFLVLHKIKPLIRLRKKIAQFGDGDMNISFKTSSCDEIGLVSNELESTRQKINNLLESRTLFLRNIMHELKTPITKGTIATQMLSTQKQKDRFSSIFGRLESLVEEFAMIEEVTSIGAKNDFKEYRLVDIIDGAIDMAMVDTSSVSVDVDTKIMIHANYRLYTTAIKNMIDNAIKYSIDSHVKILMIKHELSFENKGERLSHPLKFYIEPFTKDNPSKNSFGLGLYLVDSILKAHDQVLAYEYDNGVNRFIFA